MICRILNKISRILRCVKIKLFYKKNIEIHKKSFFDIQRDYDFFFEDKNCKLVFNGNFSARKNFYVNLCNKAKVNIGENCFFNNLCSINGRKKIIIGKNCLFGENVKLYDHNHNYEDPESCIVDQGFKEGEIIIGNNCWVGSNVVILYNVHIGDNCIIGAGCVVYKDLESSSILLSNGVIKKRC